jgi:hypothetical protein
MDVATEEPDRLAGLGDLDQMLAGFVFAVVSIITFRLFKIRRKNGVDHIQLVLQNAVLLFQIMDSIE